MPSAKTSGTVTGPVVMPPESHASPNIDVKSLLNNANNDATSKTGIIIKIKGFNDHLYINRSTPNNTATPTPIQIE